MCNQTAWVSGTAGNYQLHVCACDWANADYWPVANAKFKKYRAAQNIANAIKAALKAKKGSK